MQRFMRNDQELCWRNAFAPNLWKQINCGRLHKITSLVRISFGFKERLFLNKLGWNVIELFRLPSKATLSIFSCIDN